jgi:hypothetical protein
LQPQQQTEAKKPGRRGAEQFGNLHQEKPKAALVMALRRAVG